MPFPKIKLSDDSGNAVSVTDNRLNVNAYLAATPTIDIGDVSLLLGGTAASTNAGTMDAQTLRVTLATDDALLTSIANNIIDCETLLTGIDADTNVLQAYIVALMRTSGVIFNEGDRGINAFVARNDTLATLTTDDHDNVVMQVNSIGGLYVTGSEVENSAIQSQPLLIGGRYDSSARTLGSGDAGAVALNASGHIIMDVVDGGQLDTIIDTLETTLTAIETDQAAIEALLITIDSDTDNIQGAVGTDGSTGPSKVMSIGGTVAIGGNIQELQCDSNGILMVEAISGSSFAVQISDTSFAIADGNALGEGVLVQGDDGSDRKNIHVDASTGDVQVDVTNTVTVDGSGVTQPVSLASVPSHAVTNAGTFAVQSTLQAGSAAIGKLAANSGVDIGDVDITSIAAGNNNIGNVDIASLPAHMSITNGSTSVFHTSGDAFSQVEDSMASIGTLMSDVLAAPANTTDQDWSPLQVDTQGALYTTHGITGSISGGNGDVGTSAEDLRTAGNAACKRIDMQASPSNTGYIWVGGSGLTVNKGIRLAPGDFYSVDVNGTSDVQVLATVDGEDITYTYYT